MAYELRISDESADMCASDLKAVVDEDAGQLLADRFVDQHRGDRAVDAARQAAQHALAADLRANLGDLCRAEFGHRPFASAAADAADEIGAPPCATRVVDDFGVEFRALIAARTAVL